MVRLKCYIIAVVSCYNRFQFQMVRLKYGLGKLPPMMSNLFQFQMVRLKSLYITAKSPFSLVSIPNGSIKMLYDLKMRLSSTFVSIPNGSIKIVYDLTYFNAVQVFQFQMVRLK